MGGVALGPGPQPEQNFEINESFDTTPLNDAAPDPAPITDPWYDGGTAFDKAAFPVTGEDSMRTQWAEGDTGGNGLTSGRAVFTPAKEFEMEFDFATSSNFDDVRTTGTDGAHLFYIHSTEDGLYGDGFTLYLEPNADGNFWVDLNSSDEPSTWQEYRQTSNVPCYEGVGHHVKLYCLMNEPHNTGNGVLKVWVDDTLVVNSSTVNYFLIPNQYFDRLQYGPYILDGINDATGVVEFYVDKLTVKVLTAASAPDVIAPTIAPIPDLNLAVGQTYDIEQNISDPDSLVTAIRVTGLSSVASYSSPDITGDNAGSITGAQMEVDYDDGGTITITSNTFDITVAAAGSGDVVVTNKSHPKWGSDVGYGMDFYIRRFDEGDTSSALTFTYATSNGGLGANDATSGTDYTSTSGSSQIDIGQLFKIISVPMLDASMGADGHRDLTMTISDLPGSNVTANGRILDSVYHWNCEDKTSGLWLSGSDANNFGDTAAVGNLVLESGTGPFRGNSFLDNSERASGDSCLHHVMGDNQQSHGANINWTGTNIGKADDGNTVYYRWWMKIGADFIWAGDGPNKFKSARSGRKPGGSYVTINTHSGTVEWGGGGSTNHSVSIDLDPQNAYVSAWNEYVFVAHRESAEDAQDGWIAIVKDGVKINSKTSINLVDPAWGGWSQNETEIRELWGGPSATVFPQMCKGGSTCGSGGNVLIDEIDTSLAWNGRETDEPTLP